MKTNLWSKAANLAALKLFKELKNSGVKPSVSNPRIQQLAATIGRTPKAVVMRLGNYEYYYSNGLHGLKNGGSNLRYFYDITFPNL